MTIDRRTDFERRRDLARARLHVYRTRRDWMIAELVIGVVSCATAMTGITGGMIAAALQPTQSNGLWFGAFYGTGLAMIVVSVMEIMCRSHGYRETTLRVYARIRLYVHFGNMLCWLTAFLWLLFTRTYVASVLYQSVPLVIFNWLGACEHAKALYLDKTRAVSTSMVGALVQRLHRG